MSTVQDTLSVGDDVYYYYSHTVIIAITIIIIIIIIVITIISVVIIIIVFMVIIIISIIILIIIIIIYILSLVALLSLLSLSLSPLSIHVILLETISDVRRLVRLPPMPHHRSKCVAAYRASPPDSKGLRPVRSPSGMEPGCSPWWNPLGDVSNNVTLW